MAILKAKTLRKGSKARSAVVSFLDQWEKMTSCYFWNTPCSASGRRAYEKENSMHLNLMLNGTEFTCNIIVDCSCKNIRCDKNIYVDGERKNIAALKRLLK